MRKQPDTFIFTLDMRDSIHPVETLLEDLAALLRPTAPAAPQTVYETIATSPNGQPDPPEALLLNYLDRYGERLCGRPVVRAPSGRVVAAVAHTNNVLEQFFANAKQGLRRRLWRAHPGRDMEDQPA